MKAGFYECDITPPLGGYIPGHYSEARGLDVRDRLYARAAVLEEDGQVAAFVCVDSCMLPPDMPKAVAARVAAYTDIPEENVCVACNHTHAGAPIIDNPEIKCFSDDTYRDVCYRLAADAVTLAYRRREEVTLSFGRSELHGYSFNRNYVLEDGTAVTWNPGKPYREMFGPIDPEVGVVVCHREGKPVGALVNFALHQCCTPNFRAYSGDYSSVLARELKKAYGDEFSTVFLLGACGDINHVDTDWQRTEQNAYDEIGRALSEKVRQAIAAATPVGEGLTVKREEITLAKRQASAAYVKEKLADYAASGRNFEMRAHNLMYYRYTNREPSVTLHLSTVKLGNTAFYCMPGEIFTEFGLALKARSEADNVMVVTSCNDYCGYVPTARAFAENCDLYEASLCHHSCLVPEAGDKMVDKLLEMQP